MHERDTWGAGSDGGGRKADSQKASIREGASSDTTPVQHDSEIFIRQAFAVASAHDPIITFDSHGVIRWAGDAVERVFGWSPQEITGENVCVFMPEPHRSACGRLLERHRRTGRTNITGHSREFEGERKDGSRFPIELTVTRVEIPGEPLPCFTAIIRDITKRRRAERETELLCSLGFGIGEAVDLEDAATFTIRRICEETGWTCGEMWTAEPNGEDPRQLTIWSRTEPKDLSLEAALRAAAPIAKRHFDESLPGRSWRTKTPEWIPDVAAMRRGRFLRTDLIKRCGIRGALTIPIVANENVVAALVFYIRAPRERDRRLEALVRVAVTHLGQLIQRRRIEDALFESQRRFQEILENVDLLAVVLDVRGRITFCNDALLITIGRRRDEVIGRNWFDILIPEDERSTVGDLFRSGVYLKKLEKHHENDIVTSSGERRRILWSNCLIYDHTGRVAGFTGIGVDITDQRSYEDKLERRRVELEHIVDIRNAELESTLDQLRVADRLAAIGTLAAGLGHDVNNVIFSLRCRLDTLERSRLPDTEHEHVVAIRGSAEYLQQLADGLRLMSLDPGGDEASTARVDLGAWWACVAPLIRRAAPDDCAFEAHLPAAPNSVAVAPHRLTQAVLNLVVNAAEAVESEARIRLRAEAIEDGRFVRISVADNGAGMTDEVRRRCLDPFFTTKKHGLGTGLGLALVQHVAQGAGGSVEIDSEPGVGTTVALILPAPTPEASPQEREPAQAVITIEDKRTASLISTLLASHGLHVRSHEGSAPEQCAVWVTESRDDRLDEARRFLETKQVAGGAGTAGAPHIRRVIAVGPASSEWARLGAIRVDDAADFEQLRRAVEAAADAVQEPGA